MEINGTRPACLLEVLDFCPETGGGPHVLRKLLPSACSPIASLRLSGIGSGGLGKWNRREGCCENICLVGHHCGQLGWKLPGSSREQFEYTSDGEHLSPGPWPVGKGLLREGINALTCPDCTCVSTRSILAGVPVYVGAIYCSFPSSWISPSPLHSQFTVILHHREKEHLKFRVIHFVLL